MAQNFQTVRGMRDFLPEQARKKQFIEDFCRKTFERYGLEPIQTPIVEDFDLLAAKGSAGEAIKEEIYYFKDKGERELGLRFDMTVPLARVVATNQQLMRPFKRYCIGTVYRYDKPRAKRYREFTQADFDIVGSKSALSDFEIIQIAADVIRGLGLEFKIKVNNRGVLEELSKKCGIEQEKIKDCFRSIDKLDKIGQKEVEKELAQKGIDTKIMEEIATNSFEKVKELLAGSGPVKNLEELLGLCKQAGIKEVVFDLSLARGLEYYTGNVFEVSLNDGPSVGGGGRYDNLIQTYGGQPTPAVGCSFGVDRLLDSLDGTLVIGAVSDIFIAPFTKSEYATCAELASRLRRASLCVDVDVMERNVRKNMEYADKKGIPFVAIIGENEVKSGKFRIKDMGSGREAEFPFDDVAEMVRFVKGN